MQAEHIHDQLVGHAIEGELPRLQSLWASLPVEARQRALAFRRPHGAGNLLSIVLSHLDEETASAAAFLVQQGAADAPEEARAVWNGLMVKLNPQINASITPQSAVAMDDVWNALIERGVGREGCAGKHSTAPHHAASLSFADQDLAIERLRKMQDAGYDLDAIDEIGETALMMALWQGSARVAAFLVEQGARLDARTMGGRDLLDFVFRDLAGDDKLARVEAMCECLLLLRRVGFDVDEALAHADPGLLKTWDERYAPVLASTQADRLDQSTVSPLRIRNASRL